MVMKVMAIVKKRDDIIFLSDIRLNSDKQIAAVNDLTKVFFNEGYDFYHESKNSLRGVGILISRKLNYRVIDVKRDESFNFLLLKIEINQSTFIAGSVYGPNLDTEINFYNDLSEGIRALNCASVILAGDWNATWSSEDVNFNLDVIHMRDIPSKRRSEKINELSNTFNLTDPFRVFYPSKREYTYVPAVVENINRSRIDFFLISDDLMDQCLNCTISQSVTSNLFDHKCVSLHFRKPNQLKHLQVDRKFLNNPELKTAVQLGVIETHVNHALVCEAFPEHLQQTILESLGQCNVWLNQIKTIQSEAATLGTNPERELEIERLQALIATEIQDLPDSDYFDNLEKNCENDIFFEVLISEMRNRALSFQSTIYKNMTKKVDSLNNEIKLLKMNYGVNARLIFEKERVLAGLLDWELKENLKNYKKFEILNNEKLTPHFMNLVKKSRPDATVEDICDKNGVPYPDPESRGEDIVKFYRELYEKSNNNGTGNQLTIENFLGEVKNHPLVISAKLTDPEKEQLDRDLTIHELDEALNNCNMKSAPGLDGISNYFIKTFWVYLRNPLLKYASCCRVKGRLTNNFRRAKIRLIPKKGDTSKINNWRPISLLSCLYKLLSRVFATRLSKYMDKMTPVAQTGYSKTRRCQEVLVTLIECIQDCKIYNKNQGLLSLDIRKAFDTISHDYLNKVYKFFNFGPNIIGWLNTLGTGRQACIILENELLTEFFDLERGNAQGDTISPFCFNLGYQILLFKLNFDLQILGGIDIPDKPPEGSITPEQSAATAIYRTKSKVMAMADDATCITKMDFSSLSRIKVILSEFFLLSGLECNVEKTTLMPIIPGPVSQEIRSLGFEVKNNLTILGMVIKNNGDYIKENGENITEKIQKQVNFWNRFNLSLPGRIAVAKSMMYSQINYLGSFINFGMQLYTLWEDIITRYVKGKLNVARDRFFLPLCNGGLGLFKISNFLDAQRLGWLRLAATPDKVWKQQLVQLTAGRITSGRSIKIDKNRYPVLHCIIEALDNFREAMTIHNDNYKVSEILYNKHICKQFGHREVFTTDFMEIQNEIALLRLKVNNVINFGPNPNIHTVKSMAEVQNYLPNLDERKYRQLVDACMNIHRLYKDNFVAGKKPESLEDIILSKNKFSKKVRTILDGKKTVTSRNIIRYGEITETVPDNILAASMNKIWGYSFLENNVRTFAFKLFNNVLGTNQRVNRFVRGHLPHCTFCVLAGDPDLDEESINHLFQDCVSVEPVILEIINWFWAGERTSRRDYLCGMATDDVKKSFLWNIFVLVLKFYIWDCKLKYKLPNTEDAKKEICDRLVTYGKLNKKFKLSLETTIGLPAMITQALRL
jgi:exonuclease III